MEKVKAWKYTHPPIEAIFKLIFFLCYYFFVLFPYAVMKMLYPQHPD